MARRILPATPNQAPVAPMAPPVAAPAYPAAPQAVPMAPPPTVPQYIPPQPVQQAPLAPPQVPGIPAAPQAPIQEQLQQAMYQAPPVQLPTPVPTAPPPSNPAGYHPVQPQVQVPVGSSPMHQDMGGEAVRVFKVVPKGTVVEAEVVKAEYNPSNSKGNPETRIQLRVTWPEMWKGATFFDKCVLVPTSLWKYKSLCAACEDENGNRLLSEDNRFFTGQGPQDFVGNVVRFTAGEPNPDEKGNMYNQVQGGFESAFETFAGQTEDAPPVLTAPNGTTPMTPPPVPSFG